MKKILLIPDVHCRPGSDLSYLSDIGKLAVEQKPDILVNIGDFADMPSLSSYDVGKKSFEGRRYIKDLEAVKEGMEYLLGPIKEYNRKLIGSVTTLKAKPAVDVSSQRPGEWVTIPEIAKLLDVADRTIYRWVDDYKEFLVMRKVKLAQEVYVDSLNVLHEVKDLLRGSGMSSSVRADRVVEELLELGYTSIPKPEVVESHPKVSGGYNPRKVMLLGNHEFRINRVIEDDPRLEGTISIDDLGYREAGWEVYPFLEVVNIEDIMFSHYFTSGVMGRPVASARLMLQKKHRSCVQGHVQHRDIAYSHTADGRELVGLFCGTAYRDHHDYLGNQGQDHFRGVWILKNVKDGSFEPVAYTLDELEERYRD